MQVEITRTQTNAVERMHADVERRILLARRADAANAARNDGGRQEFGMIRGIFHCLLREPGPNADSFLAPMQPVSRLLSLALFRVYLIHRTYKYSV